MCVSMKLVADFWDAAVSKDVTCWRDSSSGSWDCRKLRTGQCRAGHLWSASKTHDEQDRLRGIAGELFDGGDVLLQLLGTVVHWNVPLAKFLK